PGQLRGLRAEVGAEQVGQLPGWTPTGQDRQARIGRFGVRSHLGGREEEAGRAQAGSIEERNERVEGSPRGQRGVDDERLALDGRRQLWRGGPRTEDATDRLGEGLD